MVGAIDLFLCSVQMMPPIESDRLTVKAPASCAHFFSAVSADASIYFAVDSEACLKDWLKGIRRDISK